ncbi:sodium:solute symporter family protein [Desertibaculum subflavum]|uniref:sodium:solute symporter family protein n=1 Tax=Desertibaculum subflavum TaxID=2268458 RepID=UPI0013C4C6B1
MLKGGFLANLGKVYGIYTGGFIGFTILIGLMELAGVPNYILGYFFIFLTIGIYALIGVLSRTAEVSEYYVAGRTVPAFYNGMATGADWMSAASFIGMAGSLYFGGYDGLAFVLGWTGGYVLVAILMAPYLRKFGQFTVPDFFSARYGGNLPRGLAVIVLVCASLTYVVAQIGGVGIITSRFLGIPFQAACFVGLIGILVCSLLGGMKAVTWTQVAQYIILIIAYLVPVVILSAQVTGIPVPQITYGGVLEKIEALEKTLGVAKSHVAPFANAKGEYSALAMWNFLALILCLMVGTASLPHILMRYFTTPSVRQARDSVGWSLFFIFLLYFTAPAYAAFAKYEVYSSLIGQPIASLPPWVANWGREGLALVGACDAANAVAQFPLCKGVVGNADGILQLSEFRIAADAVVLATPEIAGLPYVVSGLVAAGGLAAALSTADGLLLAIANALSHDIYYKMIDPKADTKRRLITSRILLLIVAVIAAWIAGTIGNSILFLVSWAFSIAAAGLFAGLVLGIWWKRCGNAAGVWGIIAGFGACMFFLVTTEFQGPWLKSVMGDWVTLSKLTRGTVVREVAYPFGINNISVGIFGIPTAFIVQLLVGYFGRPASQDMQDFIESIRVPAGEVKMAGLEKA